MSDVFGWAANRAAQKKDGWLVGWLMSDAGDVMLGVCTAAILAVTLLI